MVSRIQEIPGFEDFLKTPGLNDLRQIAAGGPLVFLNASKMGCDAFIVKNDQMQTIPLSKLIYEEVELHGSTFLELLKYPPAQVRHANVALTKILEWLWDAIVEPVLKELGFTSRPVGNDWPKVWWVPTGKLTFLPIHAAGYHGAEDLLNTALDRVVSCYASTARSMNQARAKSLSSSQSTEKSLLLVSMKDTPDRTSLRAEEEVAVVKALLPNSSVVEVIKEPSKADVVSKIPHFNVIHLACHGELEPNPSDSRILFTDWRESPFSVGEMAGQRLNSVELMYLGACDTARSRDLTSSLPDESITFAGACQVAGIATVIGTLWHIPDLRSIELVRDFYSGMLTENGGLDIQSAAWSLHNAIRSQRVASRKRIGRRIFADPIAWAAYVYVGL